MDCDIGINLALTTLPTTETVVPTLEAACCVLKIPLGYSKAFKGSTSTLFPCVFQAVKSAVCSILVSSSLFIPGKKSIPVKRSKLSIITTNGISLSPNMHRAYDRGLITINSDYIVHVSSSIREKETPFSLRQFEGKQIILPNNQAYFPLIENLNWHRRECFVC